MAEHYPTDEELSRIAKWPFDDLLGWFDFIRSIWWMPDWGWHRDGLSFSISTGGWSGNEDVIGAMQENDIAWGICWQQSKRGGHFQFKLPDYYEPKQSEERDDD